MNQAEQEAMLNNSRLLKQIFHLQQSGAIKKYTNLLGQFMSKGASLLLSILKNNTSSKPIPMTNNQDSLISKNESSKTQTKRSKLIISWKNYAGVTPEQTNLVQNILQENPKANPEISQPEASQNQILKQNDKRTPDSSFSEQLDSLKKRIKRDTHQKSSDTCTLPEIKEETSEERRQFQKIQFTSFHMLQNEFRTVKKQFQSRTEIDKAVAFQNEYQRYIKQTYGSTHHIQNKELIELKNLKRAREAKVDRLPLRKKVHLEDEPQYLYDINKIYASLENQKARRESIRIQERIREQQRLLQQKLLQQKSEEQKRQQQIEEHTKLMELQNAQILNKQLQQEQININQNQITNVNAQIPSHHEQIIDSNQPKQIQQPQQLNPILTPKKPISAEFNQIQQGKPLQNNSLQQQTQKQIKPSSPDSQNLSVLSPAKQPPQTPASSKKQNPFIKSSPTAVLSLHDIIKNNTPAFSFNPPSLTPSNNILNRNTPVVNLFTNNTPAFEIIPKQNPMQQSNTPFIANYTSNTVPNVPFSNPVFNSSFNNSSSSSSFYQSPPNISQSPAINNTNNLNLMSTVNPMISVPVQPISFSKTENAVKFFDNTNNPFMSTNSQPPTLFATNTESSSYNQNQNNRRTKKQVRIS